KNSRITQLLIPKQCDYQIHLIPGVESCFSELKFLQCRTNTSEDILGKLATTNDSIEKLELDIAKSNNNHGIIKLIKAQRSLFDVRFTSFIQRNDPTFCRILEESLAKHSKTIQYFRIDWNPITAIPSRFVNLINLEINGHHYDNWIWVDSEK